MFQDVAEFWKVLVREDFYMHQFVANKKDRSLQQLLQGIGVGVAEGCDLWFFTLYCPALASA
ncbi:hypothetical protein [Pseudomonas sp. MWU318]|uniref:hypothetical protein n=1 Tax=Pseudomonas sp. MWU318 TaxID=2802569 RepID=UPI001927B592|nr:hypothetical protein [Pseudomonas sp. MWU318]